MRDHLLPSFRVTGWTQDWYAGFPAYHFYMVLPSLAIALLSFILPYGLAFKLVAVSGLLTLPIACWAFGRLTRLPFPVSPLLAVGATAFLFDRSFSIYGGNIASTRAGEFAFSISLSFAIVFLGVVGRGLETGRQRVIAPILLALTGLCHLIPLLEVDSGTKSCARGNQDDTSNRFLSMKIVQSFAKVRDHFSGYCVVRLGNVENDRSARSTLFNSNSHFPSDWWDPQEGVALRWMARKI
jgi:hypothetical protein